MEKDYEELEIDIPKESLRTKTYNKILEIKEKIAKNKEKILLLLQFSLVGASFFGLGIIYADYSLSGLKDPKISQNKQILGNVSSFINNAKEANSASDQSAITKKTAQIPSPNSKAGSEKFLFVASKSGTVYYKTSCSNRISEKNKIYFKTEEDAQKTGLRRSKTCFK